MSVESCRACGEQPSLPPDESVVQLCGPCAEDVMPTSPEAYAEALRRWGHQ